MYLYRCTVITWIETVQTNSTILPDPIPVIPASHRPGAEALICSAHVHQTPPEWRSKTQLAYMHHTPISYEYI